MRSLLGLIRLCLPTELDIHPLLKLLTLTNGDVRKVQKLSRHSNLNTLMIYDDNRQNLQGEVTSMLDDLF